MHSFASCEMPAKYSSGKQKSRFVMFEHVSSGDSSRNGDTPLNSTYNTTPTLLQSENTPTITQHRHPAQEHVQHHSYNHRTLLQSHNTDILLRNMYNTTPTITEHSYPAQEHVQHHSYKHKTLLQSTWLLHSENHSWNLTKPSTTPFLYAENAPT